MSTIRSRRPAMLGPLLPWIRWGAVTAASATILTLGPPTALVRLMITPPLVLAVIQLARLTRAAVRQPTVDREADDRLQVLVDRTCLPNVQLVEVHATERVSPAGQMALTINLATGAARAIWFTQAHFPTGSLVLVEAGDGVVRAVDWMLPQELTAAYRHRRRIEARRTESSAGYERRIVAETTRAVAALSLAGIVPASPAQQPRR